MSNEYKFKLNWISPLQKSAEKFSALLSNKNNLEIFKGLLPNYQEKYKNLSDWQDKLLILSSFLWVLMFSYSISGDMESEFIGIHAKDIGRFKEISLIIVSLMTTASFIIVIKLRQVSMIIMEIIKKSYGDDLQPFLYTAFIDGTTSLQIRSEDSLSDHAVRKIISFIYNILAVTIFSIVSGGYFLIIISVIMDVYMHPVILSPLHEISLIVSISCLMFNVFLMLLLFPFPERDYSALGKLKKLKEENEDAYTEHVKVFASSHDRYIITNLKIISYLFTGFFYVVIPFTMGVGHVLLNGKYIVSALFIFAGSAPLAPKLLFFAYIKIRTSLYISVSKSNTGNSWARFSISHLETVFYVLQIIVPFSVVLRVALLIGSS